MGETIAAIGGTSESDVWALTDTMVLHGVRGQWVDTMDGVFVGGAFYTAGLADVWLAAGFRQQAWIQAPVEAPYAYTPPSIWHWDGLAWSLAYSFDFVPNQQLGMTGIWGSSRRDIWATANSFYGGTVIHFDGTSWRVVSDDSLPGSAFQGVWGSAPDDVWTLSSSPASVYHFDGKSWTTSAVQLDDPWTVVLSGTGARDVWVGESNGVVHFDGTGWRSYPLGPQSAGLQQGIMPVALAPGDVWALAMQPRDSDSHCTAARWDGSQWMAASIVPELATGSCYRAATGWRQGGLVAGGMRGRLDGLTCYGQFRSMVGRATSAALDAVWGASNTDLWAVGKNGTVLHGTGLAGWTPVAVPTSADLAAVWGSGSGDVWAVGDAGTAIHWNGSEWTGWPTATVNDLSAISGSGPDNVWAVSPGPSTGQVIRFDGTSWSVMRSGPGDWYSDVSVLAADDVWITAHSGFLHWTGRAFELVPSPGPSDAIPSNIKAYARDDVWADSAMHWVFHYDGAAWSVVVTGFDYQPGHMTGYGPFISKIAGDPKGRPYFLLHGETYSDGNIARIDASGALTAMPKLYIGTPYSGVFVLGDEAWLVGEGGAIEHGNLPLGE